MKKITNLLYVLAVLMLVSCNDFLDKSPKYAVDPETTVTDDVAVALTNACYKALQSSNLYNQRMWSLDIVAGNSLVGAGGGTVYVAFSVGRHRAVQHCTDQSSAGRSRIGKHKEPLYG